jgi:long-subunit fatty acid transport protein
MRKILVFLWMVLFVIDIYSTEKAGTTAFPFLKLYSGVRGAGFGENYVSVSGESDSIYYNPAGSLGSPKTGIFEYMIWNDVLSKSNITIIFPKNKANFGFGIDFINIPYEEREDETDFSYNEKNVYMGTLYFNYAREVNDNLKCGVNLKFITQDLDREKSNGFAIDVGGIYKLTTKTDLGVAIQNIGKEFKDEDNDGLPLLVRIGQASKFYNGNLIVANDFVYGFKDKTLSLGIGGEYKLNENFYPRIGYKYTFTNNNLSLLNGLSFGFGMKYKKINFDYVFTSRDTLGAIHRVSLGYKF